jgi:hypothetical protein
MTPTEIKELLNEVSPLIVVPKGHIDKGNATVIRFLAMYKELTGKRVGEGTCHNCILDAFFELKSLNEDQLKIITMERKYKLRPNALVHFNQSHYTNANITDEVSLTMVMANRNQAKSFVNGEELLADLDAGVKPAKVEKQKGKGGRPPKVVETPKIEDSETPADSE